MPWVVTTPCVDGQYGERSIVGVGVFMEDADALAREHSRLVQDGRGYTLEHWPSGSLAQGEDVYRCYERGEACRPYRSTRVSVAHLFHDPPDTSEARSEE